MNEILQEERTKKERIEMELKDQGYYNNNNNNKNKKNKKNHRKTDL